jgi:branched-chain amino acid transport system ATP-binding protein
MSKILTLEDVRFSIGQTPILNGVQFSVNQGERVGIIGPNGSGKTTLFNCISGFNSISSGSIILAGQNITNLPSHKRAAKGLGRVFQNFGIFKEMTVLENIITALESKSQGLLFPWNKKTRENRDRAFEYLKEVNLDKKANEKAGSLSGGQMRLLEIIRTVACEAQLFLLDEPTAGVSPKMKLEVEEILVRLRALGKTIMVIEHDLSFIQRLCDRIIVLNLGKVVMDGTAEEVRANPMLQEIYFGHAKQAPSSV